MNYNPVMSTGYKYKRIAESLRQRIRNGKYGEGELLPTTKMLAVEFNTTPVTIDRAIKLLVMEQLVTRTPGVGTTVLNQSRPTRSTTAPRLIGALLQVQTESRFWERLIEGVNDVLRPEGFSILIGYHNQELDVALEHARLFRDQGGEIVLFAPFDRPNVSRYEEDNAVMVTELRALGMEVIMLDRYIESVPGHFVSEYCYSMGKAMIESVIAKGYRHPICFSTDYVSVIGMRERAFLDGCRAAGLDTTDDRIVRVPLKTYQNRDYDTVVAALDQVAEWDVVVCLNSRIFNTLLYALARRDRTPLGGEPRFAGFVDIELMDLDRVVAYVEQPVREMGHAAGRMVKHLLTERSIEYQHALVPCELRVLDDD